MLKWLRIWSASMCVFPGKFIMSTCTNIVNGNYVRVRYENTLKGSEIWNFSYSREFYQLSVFSPNTNCTMIKCADPSCSIYCRWFFSTWSNNNLDFHTLLLVFYHIIDYDINKLFLCRWKIKLFMNEIKPQNENRSI